MTPGTITTLLTIVVSSVLTFLITLIAGARSSKTEHDKWARNQRFEAHLEFIRKTAIAEEHLWEVIRGSAILEPTFLDEANREMSRIELFGPAGLHQEADSVTHRLFRMSLDGRVAANDTAEARYRYLQSVRDEFKLPDRRFGHWWQGTGRTGYGFRRIVWRYRLRQMERASNRP